MSLSIRLLAEFYGDLKMPRSIGIYEKHMTTRRPKEVILKKYRAKVFNGYSNNERILYAENYGIAVKKLGIMPPGYIWTVEEVL